MKCPSLSLFTLLAVAVLFIGKTYAAVTITPITVTAKQLQNYSFSYVSNNINVVYYEITINSVLVSPPLNTALSFTYLIPCADYPTLTITVAGFDNTNTFVPGETSTIAVTVAFDYGCPVATAVFQGAGGNVVPVKSSQTVSVYSAIALSQVNVFFNGIFVCSLTNVPANATTNCPNSYLIPCASLGSNVPLEITAFLPGGALAPSPPVSDWTVDWVAGQCTAQLILLNLNGVDPTVIPTNCIQFGLQLDPTDDPTLYYNFAIETEFPNAPAFANILNACMLDLSVAGETIAEANQSAYLIGSWKVPCSLNLQGLMNFIAIFSRKTIGALSVETESSSTQATIGENAVCEVVLVNPVVNRPPCTGPVVVMDPAGAYLQFLMVGDTLVFSIKLGDDQYYTYANFVLTIKATGHADDIIFSAATLTPNSCNVFAANDWLITSAYAGATNVQAVLTYTEQHDAQTPIPKTITLCLGIVPNECPVSVQTP